MGKNCGLTIQLIMMSVQWLTCWRCSLC